MVRVIISGANGAMGKVIANCIAGRSDCTVVAGIDPNDNAPSSFPVFPTPKLCVTEADVIIDFSHPSALDGLLEMSIARNIPLVIATTGLSADQIAKINEYSKRAAIFFCANMSLGVNLMMELAKTAARVLGHDFDIEIIEKHHNQKIDAPSGTALMLADAINTVLDTPAQYVYDRHSQRKKRTKAEIGIHTLRGGTIVGEHDVIFAGRDEVLTITHTATSKEIFATGSVNAALFLHDKPNGLYSMKDII